MIDSNTLEIYNETKTHIPDMRFLDVKNDILGKKFELTLSILLSKNSKKINKKQRKKDYVPNTLSFLYSDNSGEIVMTPEVIEKESYEIDGMLLTTFEDKLLFLFIHSTLHLKNHDHGDVMEKLEVKYFKKYK